MPSRHDCVIAGGGPAGMMCGLLLARQSVDVLVLEKHADFLRDFRGDTVHPSTMTVLHELGLLEAFLQIPHQRLDRLRASVGPDDFAVADFRHLPVPAPFIALMPQWDFLNFLVNAARRYSGFHLEMCAEVTGLIQENGRVRGVTVAERQIEAPLVIAADGRRSRLRDQAGLKSRDLGAPMDVLWLRVGKPAGHVDSTLGHFDAGRILIAIDRGDYWQLGVVISKGGIEAEKAHGLPAFKARLIGMMPDLEEGLHAMQSWDDLSLLSVTVDRLDRWWQPGLLCIGDAAHAMSPVGGVGINLAVQDAVAAANRLRPRLAGGFLTDKDLQAVEKRRRWPMVATQSVQLAIQRRVIAPTLGKGGATMRAPWPLRLLNRVPLLQRLPARAVGLGVRPEHVRPDAGGC